MDWIERHDGGNYTSKRHALRFKTASFGQGRTECGIDIDEGRTGGCDPKMIDCQRCVRTLRKAGWQI